MGTIWGRNCNTVPTVNAQEVRPGGFDHEHEHVEQTSEHIKITEAFGEWSAKDLAPLVELSPHLKTLRLCGKPTDPIWIGEAGALALADALAKNTNSALVLLEIHAHKLHDAGAAAIANALKGNASVHTVLLGENEIRDEGADALAATLAVNSTVHTIHLHYNSIGSRGAFALANSLKHNSTVHTLALHNNVIGDAGAIAFADILHSNTVLRTLYLGSNEIGDKGIEALSEALTRNSTLLSLNLFKNDFGDTGAQHLARLLAQNRALRSLVLTCSNMTRNGELSIAEGIAASDSSALEFLEGISLHKFLETLGVPREQLYEANEVNASHSQIPNEQILAHLAQLRGSIRVKSAAKK